jgi:hypothetical protein
VRNSIKGRLGGELTIISELYYKNHYWSQGVPYGSNRQGSGHQKPKRQERGEEGISTTFSILNWGGSNAPSAFFNPILCDEELT